MIEPSRFNEAAFSDWNRPEEDKAWSHLQPGDRCEKEKDMKHQTSTKATVYFDPQLHKALRRKASITGNSLSAVINEAVRRNLEEDAEDLAAFEERAHEPNLSLEKVIKDMKKRGRL